MNTLRFHWFDIGLGFALLTGIFLALAPLTPLAFLLWLSLISLFLHQAEEYRYPGYFPGMMNSVMFASPQPDRYPLNANTALIVNVLVGWLTYFLAAVFAEKAVWLGIATLLISAGNFIAHTFLFNIKGKTRYNPGMSITLDGIAKGFIVDEGAAVLQESGFANVMVEAGGDLMALGEKDINIPWRIGVQAPRAETGHLTATFNVANQAVATSGDYLQAFTPDFAHHHIIDPRTGISSPELASVSVVAPSVALADGLATAVMVMGKAGLDLIENLSGCEAYAITKNVGYSHN